MNFHHGYNVSTDTNDDPLPVAGQFAHDIYELAYRTDYATDFEIRSYREDTAELLRVVVRKAYPLSIENMIYDWADTRKIQEFNVNFAFIDWYQEVLPMQLQLGATTTNPEMRSDAASGVPTPQPRPPTT